jgi:cytoskeletal protein RodZ
LVRSAALIRAVNRPPRYRHQPRKAVRPSGATEIELPSRLTPALCATSQTEAPARTAPEAPPKVAASQPITATAAQASRPASRQAPAPTTAAITTGRGGTTGAAWAGPGAW